MKSFIKIASAAALFAIASIFTVAPAAAQFSKTVVVMKGVVRSEETGRPTSVKVSIRVVGDTAREMTSSTSNSETGKYLVVLKPGKSYWVHLESDSILTQDVLVTTPQVETSQQVIRDFSVILRETEALKNSITNTQTN